MTDSDFQIIENGDAAVTIIFNSPSSEQLTSKLIRLAAHITTILSDKFENIIPGYQSLTLNFKPLTFEPDELRKTINTLVAAPLPALVNKPALVEIPVCYEDAFAPDMERVLKHTGLTRQELVTTHSNADYLVHMLGFMPGFLYLGGLDPKLSCPRKTTPATRIPRGAVAIGGQQTGVYPGESPGGWNIIGQTPLVLFKPESRQPFIASALDKIKFVPISGSQFFDHTGKALK